MADVLTIVGTYDSIKEKKQGWFEVEVKVPGKQYPYRLATKSQTLLDQVRALEGVGTFHYNESESNSINPNSGKPYVNRFLTGVEAGATAVAQQATAGGNGRQRNDVDWDAKERRDFRSRAWAVTVSAFQHTIRADEDPLEVFKRLQPFQQAMYSDVVRELAQPQQQTLPVETQAQPGPGDEDRPPLSDNDAPPGMLGPDDDIPF